MTTVIRFYLYKLDLALHCKFNLYTEFFEFIFIHFPYTIQCMCCVHIVGDQNQKLAYQ